MEISDSESRKDRSHDASPQPKDKAVDDRDSRSSESDKSGANEALEGAEHLGSPAESAAQVDANEEQPTGTIQFVEGEDDEELLAEEQPKFSTTKEEPASEYPAEAMAQSIHDAARKAAALADSDELKKLDRGAPDKAIQAAASVLQGLDAADNRDFDDWLDELDSKLAAASALLDRAAEEKEAMHKVEAEIAAAQKVAAERVERERKESTKKEIKERRRAPREPLGEKTGQDNTPNVVANQSVEASQIESTLKNSPHQAGTAADTGGKTTSTSSTSSSTPTRPPAQGSASTPANVKANLPVRVVPQGSDAQKAQSSANLAGSPATAADSATASTRGGTAAPLAAPETRLTAVPQSSTGAPMYDPELADECVKFKRLAFDDRFWRMSKLIMDYAKETAKNKWLPDRKIPEAARKRDLAVRFREALVELGPTFIKLGQFLSVRRDLLDPEMADELATLQDNVPPFPAELAIKTISAELGKEPEKLFLEFDNKPLASASIGQVHRARLHDGREVVVKVQRPDLAAKFYQDLGYMRSPHSLGQTN